MINIYVILMIIKFFTANANVSFFDCFFEKIFIFFFIGINVNNTNIEVIGNILSIMASIISI